MKKNFRISCIRLFIKITLIAASMTTAPSHATELSLDLMPDKAKAVAEVAVKIVQRINGQRLDYSPNSLAIIDQLVLAYKDEGHSAQSMNKTLIALGCYVGEVFVRNNGARWDNPTKNELAFGFDASGIRMANGSFLNPIGKLFKLIQNGQEDSVVHFYAVFSKGIALELQSSGGKPQLTD